LWSKLYQPLLNGKKKNSFFFFFFLNDNETLSITQIAYLHCVTASSLILLYGSHLNYRKKNNLLKIYSLHLVEQPRKNHISILIQAIPLWSLVLAKVIDWQYSFTSISWTKRSKGIRNHAGTISTKSRWNRIKLACVLHYITALNSSFSHIR